MTFNSEACVTEEMEMNMGFLNDDDFAANLSSLISTTFHFDGCDESSERKPKADKGV